MPSSVVDPGERLLKPPASRLCGLLQVASGRSGAVVGLWLRPPDGQPMSATPPAFAFWLQLGSLRFPKRSTALDETSDQAN